MKVDSWDDLQLSCHNARTYFLLLLRWQQQQRVGNNFANRRLESLAKLVTKIATWPNLVDDILELGDAARRASS